MESRANPKEKPKRIAAIDFGMARIGLAVSDEGKIIALPLCILAAEKKTERSAQKVVDELLKQKATYQCEWEEIVVGMPFLMSGKKGFLADEVQFFIDQLRLKMETPIVAWDERLTSVQAERSMREGSLSRKKRSQIVDSVAAVIILQNYLDSKRFHL